MDTYKNHQDLMNELSQYEWDIENLVFEGGGAKIAAYAGACKVLEELGILQKCKRFAGTSGGAVVAALLATEHKPDKMRELVALPMHKFLFDNRWGCLAFIPNIICKFGCHSAKSFLEKFKEILEERTCIEDITFKQVYDKYEKELCVVATNVSTSTVEYFHPKTTPHVSVALAVKCSMSLPGLMQPQEVIFPSGLKQLYVDGGMMINYPLHVFDGWGLSMKKEDSFLKKFKPKQSMFDDGGIVNFKTLGMNLYTFAEDDVMKQDFLRRAHLKTSFPTPNTSLYRRREKKTERQQLTFKDQTAKVMALLSMFQKLQELHMKHHRDELNEDISLDLFNETVDEVIAQSPKIKETLFKNDSGLEDIRDRIKKNEEEGKKMTLGDLITMIEEKGLRWTQLLLGGVQDEPKRVKSFFYSIFNGMCGVARISSFKPEDSDRSVGIFTDYVRTGDFNLEKEDIDFLVAEGQIGTIEYFDYRLRAENPNPAFKPKQRIELGSPPNSKKCESSDREEDEMVGKPSQESESSKNSKEGWWIEDVDPLENLFFVSDFIVRHE